MRSWFKREQNNIEELELDQLIELVKNSKSDSKQARKALLVLAKSQKDRLDKIEKNLETLLNANINNNLPTPGIPPKAEKISLDIIAVYLDLFQPNGKEDKKNENNKENEEFIEELLDAFRQVALKYVKILSGNLYDFRVNPSLLNMQQMIAIAQSLKDAARAANYPAIEELAGEIQDIITPGELTPEHHRIIREKLDTIVNVLHPELEDTETENKIINTNFPQEARYSFIPFSESEDSIQEEQISTPELEEGQIVTGRVVRIIDYGAVVDIDGIEGLIHISKLSHSPVSHPSEVIAVGDEIAVVIDSIDISRNLISLDRANGV